MNQIISIPLPDPAAARDPSVRSGGLGQARLLPFFAGPENRLVEVAVHAVLADTSAKYNPLVLAGESGLGKSHLAYGLATAYQAQFSGRPVICQPAVEFARAWADAIESQATDLFRQRYDETQLLILEDVTRLADYPSAQQTLVSLLDAALEVGHQVVATASSPPGRWIRISPALQSRLESGLCVRLARPDRDTRLAVLRHFAQQRGLRLSEPAISLLATGLEGNIRELMGAVLELYATEKIDGQPINADTTRAYLARRRSGSTIELNDIAAAVGRVFALPQSQLRGRSQCQKAVAARGAAMFVARQMTELSLQQIGRFFGGRDHTTVLHHCRKTKKLCQTEPTVQEMIDQVETILRGPSLPTQEKTLARA